MDRIRAKKKSEKLKTAPIVEKCMNNIKQYKNPDKNPDSIELFSSSLIRIPSLTNSLKKEHKDQLEYFISVAEIEIINDVKRKKRKNKKV